MADRKKTTELLGRVLQCRKFQKPGLQYASEVVLDYGHKHPMRIDYVSFEPENQMSVAGIEHGTFSCYEIKSCREDVFSGNGLNFIGDRNYLVTTMQCYKDILPDLNSGVFQSKIKGENTEASDVPGILVAIPKGANPTAEFENPTSADNADPEDWTFWTARVCGNTYRKRSVTEMLFAMLRAGQ